MKSNRMLLLLFIVLIGSVPSGQLKAQSVEVNFSVFQQDLSPYGRWTFNPRFGQVWIYEDPAFRPYATDGHWEYTNYGWSWVSDFEWGWAPFHYGRWEYDPEYGWMWIPGYEWASAWVSWSEYDGYYGWAPLGYGLNVSISFGSIPYNRWNFLPRQYMGRPDFYRYCVEPRNNYFRNAVVINNFYNGREGRFNRGPERREVERFTNNRIEERRVNYRERMVVNRNDNERGRGNVFNNGRDYNRDRNNNNQPQGNGRNNNFPTRPDNRNENNGTYNRGRENDNRQPQNNAPVINNPGNNRNDNFPARPQNSFPDNRNGNNGNYNHGRDNNNGQPQNNTPVISNPGNNRNDNFPARPQNNFPDNRGRENNGFPGRGNNNAGRPQQQNIPQPMPAPQQFLQRNMERRQQQPMPQQPQQRMERPSNGGYNEGRQRVEREHNQRPQSQGRGRGRE